MPLSKLQFQPGLVKDATDYANEGGWFSANRVRFRQGLPENRELADMLGGFLNRQNKGHY